MSEERDDRLDAAPSDAEQSPEEGGESMPSMDELMARYESPELTNDLREGDLVTGTVVQISDNGVMVDVGTKSEGLIPKGELEAIRDSIHVGDEIKVVVWRIESEDGYLLLSKRQADVEAAWEHILDIQDSGEVLEARVVEAVKGGLLVDLGLYGQGFVPASHVSVRRPRNLNKYMGQTLRLVVIEVERKRKRVVLSHRLVVENERAAERDVTMARLREGQVRRGVVRRITDFGAFIDIGGVDGLLHVSELSWKRVDSPHEELRLGEPLEVMVLKLNLGEQRISLGRRQLLADPWRDIPKMYRPGQSVRGRVLRLIDDGEAALVRLPVGWDVIVGVPDELRPAPAPAEPEPAAETPPAAVAEGVAPDDVAPSGAAPTEESQPAEAVAAAVEADATSAEPEAPSAEPEAASAESPEATTSEEVAALPASGLAEGVEVELRVERLNPVERDLALSIVTARSAAERGFGRPSADRGPRAPLARGRYSDRREEEGEREAEPRAAAAQRRDRRRDRDSEREREGVSAEHATTSAPARRTLGDLMGDKLRALLEGGEAAGESGAKAEEE